MSYQSYLKAINVPHLRWDCLEQSAPMILGRSPEADLRVPNEYGSVSRQHAQIRFTENSFWISDLNSQHGTRLNGVWLAAGQEVRIVPEDRLTLGQLELCFQSRDGEIADKLAAAMIDTDSISETVTACDQGSLRMRQLLSTLSRAELQIVLWMHRGYIHDGDLQKILHRSQHTIRTQVASVTQKLKVRSRIDIVTLLRRIEVE